LITVTPSGGTVIDFSQFPEGCLFGMGPRQIGGLVGRDVVWTATDLGAVVGGCNYGLAANGTWGNNGIEPGGTYSGVDGGVASMTYTFNDGLLSSVGGYMNYAPGVGDADVLIEVLAANHITVLESYNISLLAPIVTPDGRNAGAFRGISRASADIGAFRVSNQFAVLDNLTLDGTTAVTAVPEPATLTLVGTGLFAAWRKRKQQI
jgi:hypothetical protein